MEAFAGFGFIIVIFLIVLAILWFFLPFAVFGTKPLIEQLIVETRKNNELLARIAPPLEDKPSKYNQTNNTNDVITGG
jgi:hypothetical protein